MLGEKSKTHQSFEKIKYSSHTYVKLICGLIVLTAEYKKGSTNFSKSVLREKAFLGGITANVIFFVKS